MPQKIITFRKRSPGLVSIAYAGETFVMRGVSSKSFTVPSNTANPTLSSAMRGVTVIVSNLGDAISVPSVYIQAPEATQPPVVVEEIPTEDVNKDSIENSTTSEENTLVAPKSSKKKGVTKSSGKRKKGLLGDEPSNE